MFPNTQAVLVPLLPQPVMSKELGIEHEEPVVIHELLAAIEVHECRYVLAVCVVDELEDVRLLY